MAAMWRYVRTGALAALGACSFSPGALPSSSIDAAADGAQACDPQGPDSCKDPQTLQACRPDGTGYTELACEAGCIATPSAHCLGIVPSNGIPVAALTDGDAALDTEATGSLEIDADTGLVMAGATTVRAAGTGYDASSKIAFSVIAQTDAPSIGVFSFGALRVAAGTVIRARGTNAVAFVAQGAIAIDGLVDVTGGAEACSLTLADLAQCAGPGGMQGGGPNMAASGPGGGGLGSGGPSGFAESGGGGGGHGSDGASGGAGTTNNTTVGSPGPMFGSAGLSPLIGGGGGGGGGDEPQQSTLGATGGGGGGAIQIVSATSIALGGATSCGINAGGGGAGVSHASSGGGGGGAGGGILLEAPAIMLAVACVLAANGGGGSGAHNAERGTTGLLAGTRAPGSIEGSSGSRNSGDGGPGGALEGPAGAGESRSDEAGGGGGGVGYIDVKTVDGARFTKTGTVSPAATQSAISVQ